MCKTDLRHLPRPLRRIAGQLACVVLLAACALAQSGDRSARAAQWDGYKLASGEFTRFVDRQKGFSFWRPADWKYRVLANGGHVFQSEQSSIGLLAVTDDIPDGYGVANYAGSYLRSVRDQSAVDESVMMRRVMLNGLEWREVYYDAERQGVQFHQTAWMTAVGVRVYLFILSTRPGEVEQGEPIFKRIVATIRITAAAGPAASAPGQGDEEFEALRAKFAAGPKAAAGSEIVAATIAEDLRSARLSFDAAVGRLTELYGKSPDAAFDLTTDADPNVRAAAITALAKSRQDALGNDALVWALSDTDVFVSTAAARGLASRGATGLAAIKSKIPVPRALRPEAIVRAGVAFDPPAANELIAELLSTDSVNDQLGALQLALAMPRLEAPLPYAKLLASSNLGVLQTTVALLQRHRPNGATPELIMLLRSDSEAWAARALGEVASLDIAAETKRRIAEIDARLAVLGKDKQLSGQPKGPAASRRKTDKAGQTAKPGDPAESFSLTSPDQLKAKPEDVRLALARGELDMATRKIEFRDRWNKAADEAARRAIASEINNAHSDLKQWASASLFSANAFPPPPPTFDAARLVTAPTTGETIFPKDSVSYVMAPNFAATMERLDAALSGVQMATVRDQMTFALILKLLKTNLADRTGASVTGDAGKATGIDLKSPISLATWRDTAPAQGDGASVTRSAILARVTDRARFERLLANYQDSVGDLNSFAMGTAVLSRFAGLIPAAVPVIFGALASAEARDAIAGRLPLPRARAADSSLKPFAWVREEKLGGVTATVFCKPTIPASDGVIWETIYLAYLGETAVVASSRAAMMDALRTAAGGPPIAQTPGFAKTRAAGQQGDEIVFFSDTQGLLKSLLGDDDSNREKMFDPLLKAFGAESGALRLSQTSWETVFDLTLGDNAFTGGFKPFNADQLAAPRELLPTTTLLYAAAIVDPPKLMEVIKKLAADSTSASQASSPTGSSAQTREIERSVETELVPAMQGEVGAAILSFKPLFDAGEMPAMIFAAKLKSKTPAERLRAGTLFARLRRVENATALSSPVVALGDAGGAPFAVVTDNYFVLADSVETLKLLESKERFASSRDFARSLQNVPEGLALFATYNLEAAFDETSKALSKSESQQMLPLISALVHAFHSQRAFVTFERESLRGHLAVSFDREGRYSIGELTRQPDEFDVANASLPIKGLSVVQSERVEAMTLRVTARRPGLAPRIRDDLGKFAWQKIESGNDSTVVVTTAARRIPEKLTLQLPVTGAEFAQYLRPTKRINSTAPEIVQLAKQIAGEDRDARSVAHKIGDWTYNNLKWKKVQSDAVETLASREADCLEHSELYVALARALGLPARVVAGAALSDGSFGAHAWVEVYLGKWVEMDPTWGLMEHVDATHLRFDGDAFISYAMLNQIELEVVAAQRTVADFQRDPVRLVKEFSLNRETRDLAFDLTLTVAETLGADRWNKLEDKQRAAVIKAFERAVSGLWETWDDEQAEPVRIIRDERRNEARGRARVVTLLRGEALLRLTVAERDGAWFIVEHEIVDDAVPEFADALNGALRPDRRRGRIYEVSFDAALAHLDRLIAAEGEKPDLLLLKARVFSQQQNEEETAKLLADAEEKKDKPSDPAPPKPLEQARRTDVAADRAVALLKQITTRWPDFAPAQLALGRELLRATTDAITPLSKDTALAIAALRRYAQLVPEDPRPWRDLATAHEQSENFDEAEKAYRAAIQRDGTYLEHHAMLVNLLLDREELEKAKVAFRQMLKASSNANEVFEYLNDEEGFDAGAARIREQLLDAFPKEVAASKSGLLLLAILQEAQNKIAESLRSTQQAIAIEADADDYEMLSRLYRKQRRFTEALNAANQALKLDDADPSVHFERACSLAQLGRKREAIAALKQLSEDGKPIFFDADEPDLQPLAAMPEFKALKEKMKQALAPQGEKQDQKPKEQTKPDKQP